METTLKKVLKNGDVINNSTFAGAVVTRFQITKRTVAFNIHDVPHKSICSSPAWKGKG